MSVSEGGLEFPAFTALTSGNATLPHDVGSPKCPGVPP
jgi:hypothetical protein